MGKRNKFEVIVVVDANLTDDESQEVLNRHKEIISNAGGEIRFESGWGRRRLAYEIQKQKHGIYFLLYLEADGNIIEEMLRQFKYDEKVLKFFVVKVEVLEGAYNKFEALKKNPQQAANLVSEAIGA